MAKKITLSGKKKGNLTNKLTKAKPKLEISKKKLTKSQQQKYNQEIKSQEKWVKQRVDELRKAKVWTEIYHTTWEGYIKLLEYKYVNLKKRNDKLPHIAIYKLQKDTVERIKESFRQIEIINSQLHGKPKQELLDSDELKSLLLNLAHYQSLGGQLVTVERNNFGTLLFSIGLKILLESVQPELRERLLNFVREFNDLNVMVQRLTGKSTSSITLEQNREGQVIDIIIN